jgi:hypothetical protein
MTTALLLAAVLGSSPEGSQEWLEVVIRTIDASVITAHDRETGLLVTSTSGGPRGAAQAVAGGRVLSKARARDGAYEWEVLELPATSEDLDKLESDLPEPAAPGSWMRAFLDAYRAPPTCSRKVRYKVLGPGGTFTLDAVPCSPEQAARTESYFNSLRAGRQFVRITPESYGATRSPRPGEWQQLAVGTSAIAVAGRFGAPDQVWPSWPDGFTWLYPAHESAAAAAVAITFDRSRVVQTVRPLTGVRFTK